jgi:hypothetical protein
MQEMQEERTDEEISLHSLEKKLKNIPPIRAPSTVWQHFEKIVQVHNLCSRLKPD